MFPFTDGKADHRERYNCAPVLTTGVQQDSSQFVLTSKPVSLPAISLIKIHFHLNLEEAIVFPVVFPSLICVFLLHPQEGSKSPSSKIVFSKPLIIADTIIINFTSY